MTKQWWSGALALSLVAGCQPRPAPAPPSADVRTAVTLPPEGHQAVLREMRQMLQSVGGVATAAAVGDTALLFSAAAASGSAAAVDPALDSLLPADWKTFAAGAHGGFDTLAVAARGARTPVALKDSVLTRVAALVGSCTGCHETYRLVAR